MKIADVRDLSLDDLNAKIAELKEEQFRLGFRSATESIANPMRLREIRRDIARIPTILRERNK